MISPAASEILGFFRGCAFLSGDVCLRLCIRFSNSGVDASISAVKSGMLLGRDMICRVDRRNVKETHNAENGGYLVLGRENATNEMTTKISGRTDPRFGRVRGVCEL